jgi:hypothetical protein
VSLNDVRLHRILEYIGPFPSVFLQARQHRSDFFDEPGKITHLDPAATDFKFVFLQWVVAPRAQFDP